MRRMTKEERFFYDHAGFSYDPKTETRAQGKRRCAESLARAEDWREQEEADGTLTIEWLADDLPWDGDGDYVPNEVLGCVITIGDETVSLWGIADPDASYRRVIEAELANEAMTGFFEALGNHVRSL